MTRRWATFPRALAAAALTLVSLLVAGCAGRAPRTTFVPPSRPAQFSLAGIPWGVRGDSVTALIEPRGYNFNSTDKDGDQIYDGMLMRSPTKIFAFLDPEKRLVKFRVVMVTEDARALSAYQTARAELIKQYGAPKETVEEYQAPFRSGEGPERQAAAVKSGKGTMETHWFVGEGARQSHVSVQVNSKPIVVVDYDGPAWDRESLRRRRGR